MGAELIAAKLTRPRLRDGLITRARVMSRLDRAAASPVLLVSAPAGYGKTVAVESWLRERATAVAWVSLDGGDNDPVRLWRYVIAAIMRACDGVGGHALQRLAADTVHPAIDELARRLAADGRPVALVLEDLHAVDDERALASLDFALRVLPPNVRLVLITRTDPRLRLARMRTQGILAELRARELAFTPEEAGRLLVDVERLPLGETQVARLTARTEGWAAALYLAALWLHDAEDLERALQNLDGVRIHLSEYLAAEVLDGLDAATRSFLLRSSVLARFSAALCDHVLERDDSAALIDDVQRSNLFLTSLDGWFRYHDLFRELLLAQLEAAEPGAAARLHRRASAWFVAQEKPEEAIEHARAAGDDETVAELLDRYHLALARAGQAETLLRWLADVPESLLRRRPGLPAMAAILAGASMRPSVEVRRHVAVARRARDEHPEGWRPYHEASLQLVIAVHTDDDVGAAIEAAQKAVALARGGVEDLDVVALAVLSYVRLLSGDVDGAERAALLALEHRAAPQRPYGFVGALATLAIVAVERDRPERARVLADQSLQAMREAGIESGPAGARAHIADAVTAHREGRLPEAERAAQRALQVRAGLDDSVLQAWMILVLAAIRVDRGRLSQAESSVSEARRMLAVCRDVGAVGAFAETVAARLRAARSGALTRPLAEPPSPAEMAVLVLLPTPGTSRDIADALFLSAHTVKSHTRSIYRKLGVSSREEAVARATALGLIDSPG